MNGVAIGSREKRPSPRIQELRESRGRTNRHLDALISVADKLTRRNSGAD